MARPVVARRSSHVRRSRIRRASRPLATLQLAAVLTMALAALAAWAAMSAPAFRVEKIVLAGGTFTDDAAVRAAASFEPGQANAFSLRTDAMAEQLARLPAVLHARVEVTLPGTLVVTVEERQPRLIWQIGERRFVIDQDGLIFGEVDAGGNPLPAKPLPPKLPSSRTPGASAASTVPSAAASATASATASAAASAAASIAVPAPAKPAPSADSGTATAAASATPSSIPTLPPPSLAPLAPLPSAAAGAHAVRLPVIVDRMAADARLALGDFVDPVLADAGFRLGAIEPGDVSSTASGLAVVVDDDHGFTLSSVPRGWVAEFGFYSATLRSPTVIPNQVRALHSLLAKYGDAHVAWVWLTGDLSEDHFNTYIPR